MEELAILFSKTGAVGISVIAFSLGWTFVALFQREVAKASDREVNWTGVAAVLTLTVGSGALTFYYAQGLLDFYGVGYAIGLSSNVVLSLLGKLLQILRNLALYIMSTLKQATKAAKTKTERIVTMGQASIEDLMRKYRTEQRKKAIARAIAQILSKVFPGFNYTTAKATRIIENLTTLRLESGAVSGRILGKYELIEEIGQGGFSQVFKARNLIDDSEVAVKVLQKKWLKKREYLIRIHREGQLLGGMSCENIVRFMDRGKDDGVDCIVTELVSGQGLDDFMESRGPFAFQFALEVGVQVARALEYLHGKGIVHREIKPANIFIQPNGTIKLFDFFLAKSSNLLRFPQITLPNTFLGTPGYVSPEQAAARIEAIDSRSDIYSLGVILYEMLTGKNPFDASSAWEILQRQIHFQPPVPSKFKPDIPATVDSIVMKALAKDPPKRYQTASQFRADMERIFKCPSCGTPNWPGSTFCDTCGAQLSYPKLR